jgi:uncharacterized protein (TIGR03067 family)
MKAQGLLVPILGLFLAAGSPAGDAPRKEGETLEGTWTVVSVQRDPRERGPDEGKGLKVHVKGERVTFTLPGKEQPCPVGSWVIKTDPSRKPAAVDIREENAKGGDAVLGIYELKGDTLVVCWAPLEKRERPTEFASRPGSGHSLVVLKRDKP